ncbi:MAG: class I SAM-dependent methyltransferase [Bryobacteraceae bacterium]
MSIPPDPAPVVDLIEAFRRSKTMFAAHAMGIFDLVGGQPAGAAEVAARLNANADATERLLDGCAALGLLEKHQGIYRNAPVAETYLRSESPHCLGGYIRYSNQALYPMWGNLEDAVREGSPRWKQTLGVAGGIFDGFFRTREAARDFLMGMHGFGMLTSPRVIAAFDLSGFERLADLGGATGHLAIAACERYPQLEAVVYDLAEVTDLARDQAGRSAARDRIRVAAGDFFRDPLPEADLYAVGRILHDWADEKIAILLGKIIDRLPPGGGLLIAEKLLAEDGVGPVSASMQSLNMLVATEGKERSASQYQRLLESAGFTAVEARRTGVPLDAMLARKPALP